MGIVMLTFHSDSSSSSDRCTAWAGAFKEVDLVRIDNSVVLASYFEVVGD
jgi:hypothetical protein